METVVPQMRPGFAVKVVKVLASVLEAAAGQLIAELCASSPHLDDKRRIAVLKRQLQAVSASAGRWHMRAMEYAAMLEIRDGDTIELPDLQPENDSTVRQLHVKRFN